MNHCSVQIQMSWQNQPCQSRHGVHVILLCAVALTLFGITTQTGEERWDQHRRENYEQLSLEILRHFILVILFPNI